MKPRDYIDVGWLCLAGWVIYKLMPVTHWVLLGLGRQLHGLDVAQ